MSEEQFDYSLLDETTRDSVRQQTDALHAVARRTAHDIIEIGQRLNEVKARLGHGNFGPWLRAEFGWSQDTAGRFMAVAQRFGHIPHGAEFAPKALYLLAAPDAPEAARTEALDRAAAGERITVSTAQTIIQAHQPAPPACVAVAELAPGVRAWVGRQAPDAAGQIMLLKGVRDRTTAGLIALDALLAGGDLPGTSIHRGESLTFSLWRISGAVNGGWGADATRPRRMWRGLASQLRSPCADGTLGRKPKRFGRRVCQAHINTVRRRGHP